MITADYLRSILNYDPDTGIFSWRAMGKGRKQNPGSLQHGYLIIKLGRKPYRAHRLAWLYMTGEWPKDILDHKNFNRSDNRWENLRAATHSTNKANRPAPSNNSTGFKGVSFRKKVGRYQASICKQRQQRHLGFFDTAEEAHAAYCLAANELFGDFARVS